ncbi:MAG: helix-turn-helix domain-containing protein [Thermodesulfobacteriota bacterium]
MSLLTPQEAGDYLRIPEKTVHALCRKGKLAYVKIDERGTRRFTMEQLGEYVSSQSVPTKPFIDNSPKARLLSPKGGEGVNKGPKSSRGKSEACQPEDLRREMRQW